MSQHMGRIVGRDQGTSFAALAFGDLREVSYISP